MASDLSPEDSIRRIKSNLAEVLNPEIIDHVILEEKRPLRVYWGTATTGRPHCGYLVPMMKVAELLSAGCHVKILLADIHAYIDNMKAPMELIEYRAKYYEKVIKSLLRAVGVDISQLEFILGSSYQLSQAYTLDRFKLEGITRINVAQKAGAEVVKQTDDPTLGGLIYPLMQALDEQYLDVDAQFGGVDQRKIFTFAIENLPKIGYQIRAHLMNPMVPGLGDAAKMSASDPESKIDVLDGPDQVEKKLKKAKCVPRELEANGIIAFVEHVIFRALALKSKDNIPYFKVECHDGAEPLIYTCIENLKEDYVADILTPQLLKIAVSRDLNQILKPIHDEYQADSDWKDIEQHAYPVIPIEKKVKKSRDKGDPAKRAAALAAKKLKESS
ncbi:Tyrosine--tRNA ligase, cytoplasmic [Golovinomyces cichoracearum]|uniref:Tyrosine--tRNA ligase n=1 Tax=Golovinomyces cichoracearum TaxID=62708 RepID=A0A420IJE5_9PEZI|nr:Tyrosine--tRNA ligase, cytoplasmic [Golovinomyces cichoracearum]